MICQKCRKELPSDASFCCYCGRKTSPSARKPKRTPNGTGCAYRRGSGWTAEAVVGWRELPDDLMDPANAKSRIPIKKTKAGFKTKAEALAYIPQLKGVKPDREELTLEEVYKRWDPCYSPVWIRTPSAAIAPRSHISNRCMNPRSEVSLPTRFRSAWTTARGGTAHTKT